MTGDEKTRFSFFQLQSFENCGRSNGVCDHLYLHSAVLRARRHPVAVRTREIRTIPIARPR